MTSVPVELLIMIAQHLSAYEYHRLFMASKKLKQPSNGQIMTLELYKRKPENYDAHLNLETINQDAFDFLNEKRHGNELLRVLRSSPNVKLDHNKLLKSAVDWSMPSLLEFLLGLGMDPSFENNKLIKFACSHSLKEMAKILLEHPKVDPTCNNNECLAQACYWGRDEIVQLLLKDERIDPADDYNNSIRVAAMMGKENIVRMLLKDPRVDPSDDDNAPIVAACSNGWINVVKILLEDPRVDPSDDNNYCIKIAARKSYHDLVELLFTDTRVDPSCDNNYPIRIAVQQGSLPAFIRLIAQHPKVDVNADNGYCLAHACQNVRTRIIDTLLQCGADPSINNNFALKLATCIDEKWIVSRLLKDPRVDSTVDNYYPIKYAAMEGFLGVTAALLTYGRVSQLALAEAIYIAKKYGHLTVATVLESRMVSSEDFIIEDFDLQRVRPVEDSFNRHYDDEP